MPGCLLLFAATSASAEPVPSACKALTDDLTGVLAYGNAADTRDLKVAGGPGICIFNNVSIGAGRVMKWSIE